jgi:hypothetical protein
MNLTDARREQREQPRCPNCQTPVVAKDFGSPSEGEYIVYVCPWCAEIFGNEADALVYQPAWVARLAQLQLPGIEEVGDEME